MLIAAALWCALAVSVTGIVLIDLFQDHLVREVDAEIQDQVIELVSLTSIDRAGRVQLAGRLSGARFRRPFSGWGWQIRRDDRILAQSPSLGPLGDGGNGPLAAPAGAVGVFTGARGQRLRGLSRAVAPRFHSERLIFAIARPEDEIDRAVGQFRRAVLLALGTLGTGLIATVLVALGLGLRPLGALRAHIAQMRAGESPAPRAWPREIAPIARELDALRLHTERLVTRARGLSADLAHAIKTPLSVIRQQSDSLPEDARAALRRQADRIGQSLDRHLGRSGAGTAAYSRIDVGPCVEELLQALSMARPERPLSIERAIEHGAAFLGDEADLYEILGNPLENAAKWAHSRVRISASIRKGRLRLGIEDDGPGIPEGDRAAILERGRRLDQQMPGNGLGLAILRDLVDLYGGDIALSSSDLGGLSMIILLPGLKV